MILPATPYALRVRASAKDAVLAGSVIALMAGLDPRATSVQASRLIAQAFLPLVLTSSVTAGHTARGTPVRSMRMMIIAMQLMTSIMFSMLIMIYIMLINVLSMFVCMFSHMLSMHIMRIMTIRS